MRRLTFLILALTAVLVAVVTGCGGAARYDSRLVQADSLMATDPDSALAVLEALPVDSLTAPGDRAYRGLLVSQARYKAYVTATTDSDINRALAYYRAHSGEREKLTRAYIYKGAVMEELGHPDSAMYYYKSAEATAAPDDYFNLGYINTRIADLYRRYYADVEICFDKFKTALYYHRLTGNKRQQQNCLYNMAVSISFSSPSISFDYLKESLDLAIELEDSFCIYNCEERFCRTLSIRENRINEAKEIGLKCLSSYPKYITNDLLLDLAYIYAKLSMPDSARYFLDLTDKALLNRNPQSLISQYMALSTIAEYEGDSARYIFYNKMKSQIADSIDNNTQKNFIQRIECIKNHEVSSSKNAKINNLKWMSLLLAISSILVISIILLFHYHKIVSIKSIIKELSLHDSIDQHDELIMELEAKGSRLRFFVKNMVTFIQTAINTTENDPPAVVRHRMKETIENLTTDEFWNELKNYLDDNYNNIISNIAQNPKITEVDLRFIGLVCLGFNYIEIAITMKVSPNYISTKRKAIAKKLGIKISLQEYLENEMRGKN